LELQKEDFAKARAGFHTKLVTEGPGPQGGAMEGPPKGVTEVEYPSGDLRLKAWVDRAPVEGGRKFPAVLWLYAGFGFGKEDWDEAKPFREAGYVVMTPVVRGQNGQDGNFTLFFDEVDDVLAAADYLAKLPYVEPNLIFIAGHGEGGTLAVLAAMASERFHGVASMSSWMDVKGFLKSGGPKAPFDSSDVRELRLRSPVAYATSFKCPARLYLTGQDGPLVPGNRRTAMLAKQAGKDVEFVAVPGDAFPEAVRRAVAFFESK
jgi:dipeptidyl aminopeptidase/acylaminoacyl peptidase